jgi:hypothetical protein
MNPSVNATKDFPHDALAADEMPISIMVTLSDLVDKHATGRCGTE